MPATIAPYAPAEFQRLKIEVRPERFRSSEEQFTAVVSADEDLRVIRDAAAKAAAEQGMAAFASWPTVEWLQAWVVPERLAGVGSAVAQLWATTYKIDMGALVYRVELAAISDLVPKVLYRLARPASDAQIGNGVLRALRDHQPQLLKRIEALEWWAEINDIARARVAAVAMRTILGEADPSQVHLENEKRSVMLDAVNISGAIHFLGAAPLVLWRTAYQQVLADIAAEKKWQGKFASFEQHLGKRLPVALRKARAKGPVSIVLDAFGFAMPSDDWAKIGTEVLEKVSPEKAAEWALVSFGIKAAQCVARHAMLDQLVRAAPPPYSAHLAKCIVAAYAHDHRHLTRTTSTKTAPAAADILFWSAISRAWPVALNLVPGFFQGGPSLGTAAVI